MRGIAVLSSVEPPKEQEQSRRNAESYRWKGEASFIYRIHRVVAWAPELLSSLILFARSGGFAAVQLLLVIGIAGTKSFTESILNILCPRALLIGVHPGPWHG